MILYLVVLLLNYEVYEVLPLGKVCPIKMRQFAHGHIDERLSVMGSQVRIIKGYDCIFLLGAAAFVLAFLLLVLLVSLGNMI